MTHKATQPLSFAEMILQDMAENIPMGPSLLHNNFPAEPVSAETGRDSRNAGTTLLDTAIPCLQIVRSK